MYEKKKNPLAKLGWLGFIGVLGCTINATWMVVFVLFFLFFLYSNVAPDELFWSNVKKAATRTLIVNVVYTFLFFCFCAVRSTFIEDIQPFVPEVVDGMIQIDFAYFSQLMLVVFGYVSGFIITICTFFFGLLYDRRKERKLLGEEEC